MDVGEPGLESDSLRDMASVPPRPSCETLLMAHWSEPPLVYTTPGEFPCQCHTLDFD